MSEVYQNEDELNAALEQQQESQESDEKVELSDEPEQEEEQEEQEELKREPEPKKKANIGQRLSEVQRERYQALDEVRALREENERLRQLNNASTQTALEHYDQAVMQRLQAAKDRKIKALESGDIHEQADADIAISMATAEYHDLNGMKAQQQSNHDYYNQQQQYPQQMDESYKEPVIRQWAAENSWFQPDSDDYDEELAHQAHYFCNRIDNELYRNGAGHEIMSPEYFNVLNEHMRQVKEKIGRASRGGDLHMRQSRGTVAPVSRGHSGGNYAPQRTPQSKVALTGEERDLARRLGIDEKTYVQHKIADRQKNAHRLTRER